MLQERRRVHLHRTPPSLLERCSHQKQSNRGGCPRCRSGDGYTYTGTDGTLAPLGTEFLVSPFNVRQGAATAGHGGGGGGGGPGGVCTSHAATGSESALQEGCPSLHAPWAPQPWSPPSTSGKSQVGVQPRSASGACSDAARCSGGKRAREGAPPPVPVTPIFCRRCASLRFRNPLPPPTPPTHPPTHPNAPVPSAGARARLHPSPSASPPQTRGAPTPTVCASCPAKARRRRAPPPAAGC